MSSPTRVGREEADRRRWRVSHFSSIDPVEHRLGVVVQLAGGLAGRRVVEDVGEAALHLPGVEERLPVDVARAARPSGVVVEDPDVLARSVRAVTGETSWSCWSSSAGAAGGSRPSRSACGSRGPARASQRPVVSWPRAAARSDVVVGLDLGEQLRRAARRRAARRRPAPTARRPSPRPPGRRTSASTLTAVCAREVVAPPISSGISKPWRSISDGEVDHLVERRRDQPGQPDDVGADLARRCRGSSAPAPSRRGR